MYMQFFVLKETIRKNNIMYKTLTVLSLAVVLVLSRPQNRDFLFQAQSLNQTYYINSTANLFIITTDAGSVNDNDDWKFCTWIREKDGRKCIIKYDCVGLLCDIGVGSFYREIKCDEELSDISYFGPDPNDKNNFCGIRIPNINEEDASIWRCEVEQCRFNGCGTDTGDGTIISTVIDVKVRGY